MAIYRQGQASMDAQGYVTGYDTKWREQLTLIRPGATIFFLTQPLQAAVITEVISDTSIRAITTGGAVVQKTNYLILLHDSLTVDGLAQDVAETLRYYQSKETEIAEAIEFFKDFDLDGLKDLVNQVKESAQQVATDRAATEQLKNDTQQIKDSAVAETNQIKADTDAIKTQTQQIKDSAVTETEAIKQEAFGARDQAELARDAAGNHAVDANNAKAGAETARDEARQWAQQVNPENLLHKDQNLKDLSDIDEARSTLSIDSFFQDYVHTILYSRNREYRLVIRNDGLLVFQRDVSGSGSFETVPLAISSGGTGAIDANGIRNNIGLGEKHAPKFLSLNVENETENATTANAGIYHSKLKNTQGEDIGSSQSYFETQVGVGKHTIGVFHNGASQYYQFNENGAFSGAKSISLAPGAGIYVDGNERNASQLFSIPSPPINTWTGVSRYNWYDDYAIAGLIRRGDTHVESFGIELYQAGIQSYMHKFYPDGKTHSAQYTGRTQQMGWDDPNYWGNALVWGEVVTNNDGGWSPGLSWATQSTGGYPIRATWGLIAQGNNAWPLCSLRLRGDGGFFCNFQFNPASNDITTWSSSGNFIFQKAANSDRDLKHDIIYTDGKESYDRVMQWLPTMFKYNGSNIQRFGMIAQDLLKIDPEYVKLIPGGDIFADVIGVNDEGEEYVDRQIVVDKADDTLALDNNVIMADMACAMVYMGNKIEKMEKEIEDLKKAVAKLINNPTDTE
ncbi:tail fiber protein [Escherichia phage atuna]|uniref:Tail fiber protein n=1 Tax=Escherichia phage atuna TaxID=2696385 RepID=A0A6B9X6D8_9CAUD|nr:tail fiber protein [Escherichia phage atuna]QHR72270.1 tail fiber protein [Escherichia phage atuna]